MPYMVVGTSPVLPGLDEGAPSGKLTFASFGVKSRNARRACEAVGQYGPRVSLVLKADIRPGHTGELTGKLDRLEQFIARDTGA